MCGVVGFIERQDKVIAKSALSRMINEIRHRGPDDSGIWYDEDNAVGLAHARLSIQDLSDAGHQPMISTSKRYIVVFNGEIYNHNAIRVEVERNIDCTHQWRGHSDTETLLAAIDTWGLSKTISKITGMFSLALWDHKLKTLSLARDRLGEKPMYYGWVNDVFLFGSELKSLKAHHAFNGEVDREALQVYLRLMSIPAPLTIYKSIRKVEPGEIITVSKDRKLSTEKYWQINDIIKNATRRSNSISYGESVLKLDSLLNEIIDRQVQADVAVGSFLSGGVDSSLVTAIMSKNCSSKIDTFSIGFDDPRYNESDYAKEVAEHIGTSHNTLKVTKRDLLDVISKLPYIYDEPFSDSSQIPTYLVSELASKHVKVVLTGDGADEVFGGYNRYVMTNQYWNKITKMPKSMRKLSAFGINALSSDSWNRLLKPFATTEMIGEKLLKASNILTYDSDYDLYKGLVSINNAPCDLLINSNSLKFADDEYKKFNFLQDAVEKEMALDLLIYLPTDILVKVDRASMANSLETRIPFLDHNLIDFAWSLPLGYKVSDGKGKRIVRDVLERYIPSKLFDRPKKGFGVPIDTWLRNELREWAEELLSVDRLREDGFFNVDSVRSMWDEHLSFRKNNANMLWSVLIFQSWLESEKK